MHGKGKFFYKATGRTFEGTWKEDHKHGKFKVFQRGKFAFTEEKWIKGKRESGEADVEADDASQQMSESESEEEEE